MTLELYNKLLQIPIGTRHIVDTFYAVDVPTQEEEVKDVIANFSGNWLLYPPEAYRWFKIDGKVRLYLVGS